MLYSSIKKAVTRKNNRQNRIVGLALIGFIIAFMLVSNILFPFMGASVAQAEIYKFPGNASIVQLAQGSGDSSDTSVALLSDGSVWTWGSNSYGQLGIGNKDTSLFNLAPQRIPSFSLGNSDTPVKRSIAVGNGFVLALDNQGNVYAWGKNEAGQLGQGITNVDYLTPTKVRGLNNTGTLSAKAISAGANFALAIQSADDAVVAWGNNSFGQLGTNNTTSTNYPVTVVDVNAGGGLFSAKDISAGHRHSVAMKANGSVYAWGNNTGGALGLGDTTATTPRNNYPNPVRGMGNTGTLSASKIFAGYLCTMAILSDNSLVAWGSNTTTGILGQGTTTGTFSSPIYVKSSSTVSQILVKDVSLGYNHVLATKMDDTLVSWGGSNAYGQLGQNTTGASTQNYYPANVKNLAGESGSSIQVKHISANGYHSLAFNDDTTTFYAWGRNNAGQLGNFLQTNCAYPQKSVVSVAAVNEYVIKQAEESATIEDFKLAQETLNKVDISKDDCTQAQKNSFQLRLNKIVSYYVGRAEERKDNASFNRAQAFVLALNPSVDVEDASKANGEVGSNGKADATEYQARLNALGSNLPDPINPHGGFTSNTDMCSNCHSTHNGQELGLIGGGKVDPIEASRYCVSCHDGSSSEPSNLHKKYFHNESTSVHTNLAVSNCTACHDPHAGDSTTNTHKLKGHFTYQHTSHDTTKVYDSDQPGMDCKTCHRNDLDTVYDKATFSAHEYKAVMSQTNDLSLCFSCHGSTPKQSAPNIEQYYKRSNPTHGKLSCASCHETHGADNPSLLKSSGSSVQQGEFCTTCHNDSNFTSISDHAGISPNTVCTECHTQNGNMDIGFAHAPTLETLR